MGVKYVEAQGKAFLKEAVALIDEGKAEDVLRHALSAKLPLMFPDEPWWTKAHVTGTEAHTKFHEHGGKKHGFVDVLVGATVIEYEPNLHALGAFAHGLHQVKQYLAGRLNAGTPTRSFSRRSLGHREMACLWNLGAQRHIGGSGCNDVWA